MNDMKGHLHSRGSRYGPAHGAGRRRFHLSVLVAMSLLLFATTWAGQLVVNGQQNEPSDLQSLVVGLARGEVEIAAEAVVDQVITVTPDPGDEPVPITVTPEASEEPSPITVTPEMGVDPGLITVTPDLIEPTTLATTAAPPSPTPTWTPSAKPSPTTSPTPYPPVLANISTRGYVGTGDDVLIPGFIVKNGPIRVVLRARGPFMAATVPGSLLDPQLRLIDNKSGVTLGINDNWETGNCKTDVPPGFSPSDPRESCLVATLAPGEYTFIVSGVGGTKGVALGEVFRVDGSGKLSNISTRGLVLPEPRELIGGLIIQRSTMPVVIRGLGPSLPLAHPLCDPKLTLFDKDLKELAFNGNWGDGPVPPPGFAPAHPKEALIAITLPPGEYTAVLGSEQACTGIGLVEVFNTAP